MNDRWEDTGFWEPSGEECAALRLHLLAELPPGHVLWPLRDGLRVEARDRDGDRLLVATGTGADAFALVHMTWAGRPPMASFLPETETYDTRAALLAALRKGRDA